MESRPRKSSDVSESWDPSKAEESRQVVSFRVGSEDFGLGIQRVQEIIRHQALTRVPNSPAFVEGVVNLRGKVIPVIALRKRFGVEQQHHDGQSRIVILEVNGMVLGFIVDSVPQVPRIPVSAILDSPRVLESRRAYVSGVVKLEDRLLILLDVDRVLDDIEAAETAG